MLSVYTAFVNLTLGILLISFYKRITKCSLKSGTITWCIPIIFALYMLLTYHYIAEPLRILIGLTIIGTLFWFVQKTVNWAAFLLAFTLYLILWIISGTISATIGIVLEIDMDGPFLHIIGIVVETMMLLICLRYPKMKNGVPYINTRAIKGIIISISGALLTLYGGIHVGTVAVPQEYQELLSIVTISFSVSIIAAFCFAVWHFLKEHLLILSLERYIREGRLENFEKSEALAMLLSHSNHYEDASELAHRLINYFGSYSNVFKASIAELLHVEGMRKSTATIIKMMSDTNRMYMIDEMGDLPQLDTTEKQAQYCKGLQYARKNEMLYVICLNIRKRVIADFLLVEGSPTGAEIDIHKLIQQVKAVGATSALLTHNHPGGVAVPSEDDIYATQEIIVALKTVGVKLEDHIIVASKDDWVSLRKCGLLWRLTG